MLQGIKQRAEHRRTLAGTATRLTVRPRPAPQPAAAGGGVRGRPAPPWPGHRADGDAGPGRLWSAACPRSRTTRGAASTTWLSDDQVGPASTPSGSTCATGACPTATSASRASRRSAPLAGSHTPRGDRPGRAGADQGPRADPHLRGLPGHAGRPVRPPPSARRAVPRRAAGAFGVPGDRRPVERRAPEPGLRERGRLRPLRVHRDGERALPGRPRGERSRNGSPSRILRYKNGRLERQWVYETDPVAEPPVPATAFSVNGIVELLPLTPVVAALDGALLLGRRADAGHDQALRRRLGSATAPTSGSCWTSIRSASRSTTSRA